MSKHLDHLAHLKTMVETHRLSGGSTTLLLSDVSERLQVNMLKCCNIHRLIFTVSYIGTQEIHFGRKTNEIAKFSIFEEKTKCTILDEIWTKNGKLIAEKNVR